MSNSFNHLLDQLDDLKSRFGSEKHSNLERILARISRQRITDVEALIRFHEILLFLSAYPQSARLRQLAESQLRSFDKRVAALRDAEIDLSALPDDELTSQMHSDLYDGMADEIAEGTNLLLGRGWGPDGYFSNSRIAIPRAHTRTAS